MTAAEFSFSNDEWVFGPTFVCADLELTLATDIDDYHGAQGVSLESVRAIGPVPTWLSDAMTAWVADNQDRLRAHYEQNCREFA